MKKVLIICCCLLFSSQIFAQIQTPLAKKGKKASKAAAKKNAPKKPNVVTDVLDPSTLDGMPAPVEVKNTVPVDTVVKKVNQKKPPKDGFAERADIDSSEAIAYAEVRDEDIIYRKRLWREIDLRDTINAMFRANKSNLMSILLDAIKAEELTAYSPKGTGAKALDDDDTFQTPLSSKDALRSVVGTVQISDSKTGSVKDTLNDYNPDLFMKFRIKEDWILDQKRSIFEARIVGIAPLKLDEKTNNWQPVFWINFNEARELLSKKRIINVNNDGSILTFDDVFTRRLFASNVTKETNLGDNKIKDLIPEPKLRLYESDRIKTDLMNFEQSLWEY